MTRWQAWYESRMVEGLSQGETSILTRAEQEIEQHFADFERKMMAALGNKKEGWISGGLKALGGSLTGDERAKTSPYYGFRGTLGKFFSGMGERMRPRTSMERDYKVAEEAADHMIESFLRAHNVVMTEATIPDWIAELKQKIMGTLQQAVSGMFSTMSSTPQAIPVKQPTGKAADLHQLVVKYGGLDKVPAEEINKIYKPLVKGGHYAATKKALAAVPPMGRVITDPRDIHYGN